MPIKANTHPNTARLVNLRFRTKRDKIAVVTITPPREICQTELSTMLSAMYENRVESISMRAGKKAEEIGALGF